MNIFRFRLQQLLNFRIRKEDSLKRDMAEARQLLYNEELRLQGLRDELVAFYREWEEQQKRSHSIEDFRVYHDYQARLQLSMDQQRQKIADQEKVVEEVRNNLVAASKDKRVLERLKDRKHQEYVKAADKEEQGFLDHIGTRAYSDRLAAQNNN